MAFLSPRVFSCTMGGGIRCGGVCEALLSKCLPRGAAVDTEYAAVYTEKAGR